MCVCLHQPQEVRVGMGFRADCIMLIVKEKKFEMWFTRDDFLVCDIYDHQVYQVFGELF